MLPVEILISLRECADWSKSSLGKYFDGMFSDVMAHLLKNTVERAYSL